MELESVVDLSLKLTCQSTGFPQPSIVWQFNSTEMACTDSAFTFILGTTTAHTHIVATRVVSGLIHSATCVISLAAAGRDHRGNFTCMSNNLVAGGSAAIEVFVLGK